MKDGEPCGHPGCLHHVKHPCEGCGRIAGRNASFGYVEEIPEGSRGFGKYKYRVIGRLGSPIHHTDSKKEADDYLELCRIDWRINRRR